MECAMQYVFCSSRKHGTRESEGTALKGLGEE